jgi:Bromodomain
MLLCYACLCLQVVWDFGQDMDTLSPWELHSMDTREEALAAALQGASADVVTGCSKLLKACYQIMNTVRCPRQQRPCAPFVTGRRRDGAVPAACMRGALAMVGRRSDSCVPRVQSESRLGEMPLKVLPTPNFRPSRGGGANGRHVYYNTLVPLPLSVGIIMSRAESRWYRTLAQMRVDVELLVHNAALFYAPSSRVLQEAQRIAAALAAALDARAASSDDGDGWRAVDAGPSRRAGSRELRALSHDLADDDFAPRREMRSRAATRTASPEAAPRRRTTRPRPTYTSPPASPDEEEEETLPPSRSLRKRRRCAHDSWGSGWYSEERSAEPAPADRPRTRQRVQLHA